MNIIEVKELSKNYGKLTAVDKVSFQVAEGEIFGFLGPNGAGKTTTISMLCTLLKPTSGTATLNGFDIIRHRSDVRRSIGLVFQEPALDEYLSAEQNLRFHAYAYNVSPVVREKRINEVLELVELADRRRSKVSTFSGGMKRRLEIARGLLHNPKVLFLDEPTLGLDPQTRRHIWDYVLALRKQSKLTIFLTTHYMDEAENCDRISIIDHGHIIALDSPDKLKDAMGGDVVTLKAADNEAAAKELKEKFNLNPVIQNGNINFNVPQGELFLPKLMQNFQTSLVSIGIHRPTLEDVFLKLTGDHERYHSLVEATTEGTLLVVNDRCRYANPTFLNMSGYSARQLEFLELEDLVRREDENTDFWQRFDFLTNQEPPHGTELQATGGLDGVLRCADGEKLDCVFILNPIVFAGQSGLILLAKDVAHGSAVLAQDVQPLTAQAAPVGIFRARLNRRASIQEMNTTAKEFFADPNPSLADIFMDSSEFDEIISSLQDGNQVSNHLLQTSSPDASMHFISLSAKVVNDANEQGAFIAGTLQDVTEQHRGELERGKLVEKLQASLLFLHEPLSRLGRNVLICDFQMSVSELARLMTARNTTAAIITSEKNMLGIVTDHDLRTRVLASGASASMPIHTIMSAPLVKISEDALIYEALLLMEEKNIRHLAIEDHEGQIVNVVDNKSLIQFQSYGTVVLIREISHATNPQDISLLAKRTPLLAQTLIDSSTRPRHVTRMLASICDSATERLVQLAIDELGPPPSPYAFISMGSQGRQEQTLLTDQDNGIIYVPSSEAEAGAANDYFLQMGKRVCEGLEHSGYPYCRGGVMANNPRWCRSLPDWISSFREGIQTPEPQEIIDLSIFLDFRTVCGDNEITRELRRAIELALAGEPAIYRPLAEGALNFKPPLRLLGSVYLGGGETEHLGEINLKDAMMPIVTFARLYSLRYQVGSTHTVERIESLSERGEILPSSRDEIISSYDFLMQLRLQSQLTVIKRGLPLTNVVRVNQLGYMQQEQLKQSFAQISAVQKKIEYDFLSGG